jgi:hypothetical protein
MCHPGRPFSQDELQKGYPGSTAFQRASLSYFFVQFANLSIF